jgi:hypothetical protein
MIVVPAPKVTAESLLAALGRTRQEVAATLAALKVTGDACSSATCPIARYLAERLGASMVAVSDVQITVYYGERYERHDTVTTPAPVADFIHDLDSGAHPELITAGVVTRA